MSVMASQITGVDCLLNRLFRHRSKKTSKMIRVIGLFEGNPPVTGGFPSQRDIKAESVSILWRHHDKGHVQDISFFSNFTQSFGKQVNRIIIKVGKRKYHMYDKWVSIQSEFVFYSCLITLLANERKRHMCEPFSHCLWPCCLRTDYFVTLEHSL